MTAPSGPTLPRPPRAFAAGDVLNGSVNLDGYPFRFIYLTPGPSAGFGVRMAGPGRVADEVDLVFTAAEFLETRGWQVVTFLRHAHDTTVAYLRRVSP